MASTNDELFEGDPEEHAHDVVPLVPEPGRPACRSTFAEYKSVGREYITLVSGEYYPDILKDACELYGPVLVLFGKLLHESESSAKLLMRIAEVPTQWMRIQLARVFRKYISPETPVEMLKKKSKAASIVADFSGTFRPIPVAQKAFDSRPMPDEAICAVLWEYKDRGKKGYDLTTRFFEAFGEQFPDLKLSGPISAGRDIRLHEVWPDYPNPNRPVDFVVMEGGKVLAIGLARYDGDRGGAQEDDRIGGYVNCADEILNYCISRDNCTVKVLFLNDGPGLLLGSMWDDYSRIEARWPGRVMVLTLRMLPERITLDWLRSEAKAQKRG